MLVAEVQSGASRLTSEASSDGARVAPQAQGPATQCVEGIGCQREVQTLGFQLLLKRGELCLDRQVGTVHAGRSG